MGPWLLALFVFVVCGSGRRAPPPARGGRAGLTCRAQVGRGQPGGLLGALYAARSPGARLPSSALPLWGGGGLEEGGVPPYLPVTLPSGSPLASHLPDDPEHPPGRLEADGAGVPAPAAPQGLGGGDALSRPPRTRLQPRASSFACCPTPAALPSPAFRSLGVPGPGTEGERTTPAPGVGWGRLPGTGRGALPEELKRFPTRRSQGTWGSL